MSTVLKEMKVENNTITWETYGDGSVKPGKKDLPFPLKSYVLTPATVVPIIVAWILMVIIMTHVSYGKRLGVRLENDCGVEHLENETTRYYINKAYNERKQVIPAITNVMLVSALLLTAATLFEVYLIYKRVYDVSGFAPVNIFLHRYMYYAAAVMIIATILGMWIRHNILWKKISSSIKYGVIIPPSTIKELKALYLSMMFLVARIDIGFFTLFAYYDIMNIRLLLFAIVSTLLFTIIYFTSEKILNLHNNVIAPYTSKTKEVNDTIVALLKTNDARTIERYLLNNIKRSNPSDTTVTLTETNKYKDSYYQYMMHKNGKESFSDTGNSQTVALSTIKNKLRYIYMTSIRSIPVVDFNSDITNIMENIEKRRLPTPIVLFDSEISRLVRFHVFNLIYEGNGFTLPDVETLFRYVPLSLRNVIIESYIISDVIGMYTSGVPEGFVARFVDTSRSWTAGEIMSELLMYVEDKYQAADIFITICLNMRNFDISTSIDLGKLSDKVIDLQNTMSTYESNSIYTVLTLVRNEITKLLEDLPLRDLQRKMAALRNMDNTVMKYTSEFTNSVFWMSVVIAFILAFFVFHFLYKLGGDSFTVVIVSGVLFTFVASALYSWFIGGVV